MPLAVGETFERYEIESLIGRGGMGEVYRATDTRLRRKVALKVLRPDRSGDEAVARLFREARSAAGLSHPNTVAIHDVGEAEGIFYIVMELVTGAPLLKFVGDDRVPVARKLGWLVDVARALSAAHKAGVIHRDVKPSNVMVSDDGIVKVLDFGLAKSLAPMSFRTEHGHSLGTPRYMSPEQVAGAEVDARTDQYAFGLTAYELVAGKHPGGVLAGSMPPPPLEEAAPDVTRSVAQVIGQAMAREPSARFASMDEVVVALEDAIAGRPVRGLAPATSVAAMSAVPETVADTMPFGATAPRAPSEPDLEAERPTLSAGTTEAALEDLATGPTAPMPALHHVIGATVPVGPSGTMIDAGAMGRAMANAPRPTMKSAASSPPPGMQTLVSAAIPGMPAPTARELIAEASGASAATAAPAAVPVSTTAPAGVAAPRRKTPLLVGSLVLVALGVGLGVLAVRAGRASPSAADHTPSATSSAGANATSGASLPSAPVPAPSAAARSPDEPAAAAQRATSTIAPPGSAPHLAMSPSASASPSASVTTSASASRLAPVPTPTPTPTPRKPAPAPLPTVSSLRPEPTPASMVPVERR